MKKIAVLLAILMVFAAFSIPSFAAPVTEQTDPPAGTVALEATLSNEFTVAIPSGTKNIGITQGASANLGSVQFASGNIGADEVLIIAAETDALRLNGDSTAYYADYSLSDDGIWMFDASGAPETAVTATVTDISNATVAGTYSDIITFTVFVTTVD